MNYFVMLITPNGNSVPLMTPLGEMAFYETVSEAKAGALNTPLGQDCGYEVFELGGGVYSD